MPVYWWPSHFVWHKVEPDKRHGTCPPILCTIWPRDARWAKWRQIKDGPCDFSSSPTLPTTQDADNQEYRMANSMHVDEGISRCTTGFLSTWLYLTRMTREMRREKNVKVQYMTSRHSVCWWICHFHVVVWLSWVFGLPQLMRDEENFTIRTAATTASKGAFKEVWGIHIWISIANILFSGQHQSIWLYGAVRHGCSMELTEKLKDFCIKASDVSLPSIWLMWRRRGHGIPSSWTSKHMISTRILDFIGKI